jgi:hypothetical protein
VAQFAFYSWPFMASTKAVLWGFAISRSTPPGRSLSVVPRSGRVLVNRRRLGAIRS